MAYSDTANGVFTLAVSGTWTRKNGLYVLCRTFHFAPQQGQGQGPEQGQGRMGYVAIFQVLKLFQVVGFNDISMAFRCPVLAPDTASKITLLWLVYIGGDTPGDIQCEYTINGTGTRTRTGTGNIRAFTLQIMWELKRDWELSEWILTQTAHVGWTLSSSPEVINFPGKRLLRRR